MRIVVFLLFSLMGIVASPLQAAPALEIISGDSVLVLDRDELETFPQTTIVTETPFYEGLRTFTGPSLNRVLEAFRPQGEQELTLKALNDYEFTGTLAEILSLGAIVATRADSRPMSVRDRGPFWIMLPLSDRPELNIPEMHRYMVWQLSSIELH